MSSSTEEFFHVLVSPGFEPGTSHTFAECASYRPRGKGKFTEKLAHIKFQYIWPKIEVEFYNDNIFLVIFLSPVGLGIARLARIWEILGSIPGETRTWKNSTVEELISFFITLRVHHSFEMKKTLNNSSKKYEPILDTAIPFG